jgi:uncharacterized ion transporter superfamily protein YfcC
MTKPRSMDPILLVGSVVVLAAILTWVLPAGRFQRTRDTQTGRTVVVPGSYKPVPRNPIGPWGVLLSIPQGLNEAAAVVFYIFLAGGALTVIEATGAIGNTLDHLMWRFGKCPLLILLLASLLFLIGGATYQMSEEILALIPVLCALMRRLRLGNEMAVGISLGTAVVAAAFSPFNTFALGIAQPMAELRLFSGAAFRTVVFILAMGVWGGYLAWYATRSRRAVAFDSEENPSGHPDQVSKWRPQDIAVLAALNGGMLSLVLGAIFLHWDLPQFSAVFVAVGFVAGLAGGLGWHATAEQFAEGFRRLALAAVLVGFARAISVVLANGSVLDTIANALFSPLRHLSLSASAVTMFLSESALAFPMPSESGRAMMSLPILIPLGDLLGLSRQMVVNSFLYTGVTSGLVTPTYGAMLAMLALAGVSYAKWLRFIAAPMAILFVLCAAAMVIGVKIGIL